MKLKRLAALILATLLLAGCSAKMEADNGTAAAPEMWYDGVYDRYDGAVEESNKAPAAGSAGDKNQSATSGSAGVQSQKLIRTMSMEVETDDMDALLGALSSKITALGGYVENKQLRNSGSSTRNYRYADLKVRIPVARMDEFVDHVSDATNVVYYNENADDITLRYVATESRVKALQTEQDRLLELLAKADNMSDLLQIESRLTDVRYELENVTSQLKLYDNLVDYGTIQLSVTQVQEYTVVEEETVWQRIGSGIARNWKGLCEGVTNLFVFFIVSLPYLIPLGAGVAVVVILARKRKQKRAHKQQPNAEE